MPAKKPPTISTPTVIVRKKRPATPVAANAVVPPKPSRPKPQPTSASVRSQTAPSKPTPVRQKTQTAEKLKPLRPTQPSPQLPVVSQHASAELSPTPGGPNRRQREMQAQWELLAIFRQRWPLVFPEDIRQVKPLARSIHQVIIEQLPDIKPWRIRGAIALFQRIGRGAYWRALVKGGPRYDLDGQPNGEVTAAEQEKARQDLEALAARRKAKGQGHPQTETAVSAAGENTTTSQEKPASAAEF